MTEPVYAPFKGAVEPPPLEMDPRLRLGIRLAAWSSLGLVIIIISVAAIVS